MATDTLQTESAPATPSGVTVIDVLGEYIGKTHALIRAIVECDDEDDKAWLISMARDEIEIGSRRYFELSGVPGEKPKLTPVT